jgi:hypothetical protein
MNKIVFLVFTFILFGCDSENGSDCFKKEGTIVQREIDLGLFTKIVVYERVQLFIEKGDVQKVIVESGENLINDVEVKVDGGLLTLVDNNTCNFIRDYDITKVYVTSPNITEIRNSSGLEVTSIGVLSYPELELLSENYENEDVYHNDGNFKLTLNVEEITITTNGFSTFRLSGNANTAFFNAFSGNTNILTEDLTVNEITIFHRSTGRIIIRPIESLRGKIVGIGNVIAKNRPPIIEVEVLYTGELIFED